MSMILVNCPPRACSIRCTICQFITHVGQYCFPPPPTPPPPHASSYHNQLHVSLSPRPSQYGQMPAGQPAGMRSKKRAVVCGVLYRNSRRELKGSVNDAKSMKGMLQRRFNFPESSTRMLTEEESSSYKPTKENIRRALHWLVEGCEAGDSLVFYFSGHGHQQRNYSGDEIDGSDETLCPMDFETEGMIVDDEINQTIVRPLLPSVKLHAIFDAWHGGTMLDLPFLCRMNRSSDLVFYSRDRPRTCNYYVRHLIRFNKVDHG